MATDPAVEAAYQAIRQGARGGCSFEMVAESVVSAVTPLIRAQAFTEAADAIQATVYYVYPPALGHARARLDGLRKARDEGAALVRGLGEETENA